MNNKSVVIPCLSGMVATVLTLCANPDKVEAAQIVTANRSSGNISVIDVETKNVFEVNLPGAAPEPMYVFQIPSTGEVAVGDRNNQQVVFFDPTDYSVTGTVSAGDGVFHMWGNPQGTQLWVNNDIDDTISVINPQTKTLIDTIDIPADIVAAEGSPHDVVLDDAFAYVSILFPETGPSDTILKFSLDTFTEVDRQDVGGDPHLSLTLSNDLLYVPTQENDAVEILSRDSLDPISSSPLNIPGAHGAGMAADGQTFYTTNISGGGPQGLWTIDTTTNTIIGSGEDTPAALPHNIALTSDGLELYISHSGASSDLVSFYSIEDQVPTFSGSVEIGGLNPFGIAFVASTSVPEPGTIVGVLAFVGTAFLTQQKKQK